MASINAIGGNAAAVELQTRENALLSRQALLDEEKADIKRRQDLLDEEKADIKRRQSLLDERQNKLLELLVDGTIDKEWVQCSL